MKEEETGGLVGKQTGREWGKQQTPIKTSIFFKTGSATGAGFDWDQIEILSL